MPRAFELTRTASATIAMTFVLMSCISCRYYRGAVGALLVYDIAKRVCHATPRHTNTTPPKAHAKAKAHVLSFLLFSSLLVRVLFNSLHRHTILLQCSVSNCTFSNPLCRTAPHRTALFSRVCPPGISPLRSAEVRYEIKSLSLPLRILIRECSSILQSTTRTCISNVFELKRSEADRIGSDRSANRFTESNRIE